VQYNAFIDTVNALIRSNAAAGGYTVVDLAALVPDFAVGNNAATYSFDGIHGLPSWYALIAATWYLVAP
jgi:hypothetical protein